MKKLLATILALVLALSLCVPALAEGTISIVVNLKTLSSEYWQTVKSGCDEAAAELGIEYDIQGAAAESEIAEQVAQIETQLAGNPDAIIIAPNDGDAVIGVLESTGYTGPVIFCDTDCAYEAKTAFVGTSNEDAAYKGGIYAIEKLGEGIGAVIIYGQEGDNTSNLRKSGYEKALAENGITPLAALSGNNTTDGATKAMEDLLNAYPDQINLVFCHNDDTAIGALNACQAAGVEGVTIIGFDGNASAIELIASGDLAGTIAQQPKLMGYQAVYAAYAAATGETIEAVQPVDVAIIDAENVADYL